jgi:hypothetical protein
MPDPLQPLVCASDYVAPAFAFLPFVRARLRSGARESLSRFVDFLRDPG